MKNQSQTVHTHPDHKNGHKPDPTPVAQPLSEPAGFPELPESPLGAVSDASIAAQVVRLNDQRWQMAQRQAMAAQIGDIQGNRHLQGILVRRSYPANVIQRRNARRQKINSPVGGEPGNVTFLPRPGGKFGETLAPGEGGYSREMLLETSAAAEAISDIYEDSRVEHVVPYLADLDQQLKQRAREKQIVREQEYSARFGGSPRVIKIYTDAVNWCQTHMNIMENDRREEEEKAAAFNAWVPRANSFYTSLIRLEAMQNMLGVRDPMSMAAALEQGLRDAQAVGQRAQLVHDIGGGNETLDVPAVDETVVSLSNETTQAARELNTAYIDFQQNLLGEREKEARDEGAADEARLAEINKVKSFVRNVGRTVDFTMSVVSNAPTVIANATSAIKRGEATLNAYRNRRQIMAGQRPTHNPTYLTTSEKGELIVRNVQTGMDRPAGGGEQTPSPETSISLPTSVSDLLGGIADFIYAKEVREINSHLEQIKSRCEAIAESIKLAAIKERAQNFQDKLNNFALKCAELQRRMAQRRQAYLEFGVQLDNFARDDRESRRAGQAPGKNEERFATIMTVVSQVREVLAIGNGALEGFDTPQEIQAWALRLVSNRSDYPNHSDVRILRISDNEWKPLDRIYGQVSRMHTNISQVTQIFSNVEAQSKTLIGTLHQGGGRSDY